MRKLILFAAVLFFLSFASAGTIVGVSPPTLDYKNVLRNGYSEKFLTLTIDSDELVGVNLEAFGEVSSWLNFTKNFSVSRVRPARLLVSARPPSDIPNGNYTGYIRVSTLALGPGVDGENLATAAIRAVLDVVVSVEITDVEVLQCSAGSFSVKSAEKGDDIVFNFGISNSGNIRISPNVNAKIWDQDQITLVKEENFKGKEILPTKQEPQEFRIKSNDLYIGQYWMQVEVPECTSEDTLTFDVLEPGALKADGILRLIDAIPHFVIAGDTMTITADFENTGEKDVEARFRGRINLGEKIVQVIESEPQNVRAGETYKFNFYYTPKKTGKYVASGRVFYDKKRTFESSTTFEVLPIRMTWRKALEWSLYLLIIFIIGFLLYKIRKEKRRYLDRVRSRY